MPEMFTTADGLSLAYDVHGPAHADTPPVLCLAGLTRNMEDFDPVVDAFSDRVTVIRLDSRGRGASDYDPNFMNYSIPQEGADALALLDHLGIEKAAILGTSRGGLIAMVLVATAKHRLAGVLLNDIGPDIAAEGLVAIMSYLGRDTPIRTHLEAAEMLAVTMAGEFKNMTQDQYLTHARRLWTEDENGLHLRYDPKIRDAIEAQSAIGDVPSLWPLFDAMEGLPLAALRGENSQLLSPDCFETMKTRRPDMIAAVVADRGHVPFLDEPESRAVISGFLDALAA